MTPARIQRKRTPGWKTPPNAKYVGRPTKWGNPFVPGRKALYFPACVVKDHRHAAKLYLGFAHLNSRLVAAAKSELRGKNLSCWCSLCDVHQDGKPLGSNCPYCDPCHVDTLLEL